MAIYILESGIKGVCSVKLHRDLDVTQNGRGIWRTESAKRGTRNNRRDATAI